MPEIQGQLRRLDPHVLCLLGQVQCAALPQAALAPAALLMEEVHGKLVDAMTRARRPAFLNAAAAAAAAAQDEPTGKLSIISPSCIFHQLVLKEHATKHYAVSSICCAQNITSRKVVVHNTSQGKGQNGLAVCCHFCWRANRLRPDQAVLGMI